MFAEAQMLRGGRPLSSEVLVLRVSVATVSSTTLRICTCARICAEGNVHLCAMSHVHVFAHVYVCTWDLVRNGVPCRAHVHEREKAHTLRYTYAWACL